MQSNGQASKTAIAKKYKILAQVSSVMAAAKRGIDGVLQAFRGPTRSSSWVIPGRLLYGAYPSHYRKEPQHTDTIQSIIQAGVTHIVNLLEPEEKQGCVDYCDDYLAQLAGQERTMSFTNFPIPDLDVVADDRMIGLVDMLFELILADTECVLVHCWGGHGRSGTVAGTVLGIAGAIPSSQALQMLQAVHGLREYRGDWASPQTGPQREQVARLIDHYRDHPRFWGSFPLDLRLSEL